MLSRFVLLSSILAIVSACSPADKTKPVQAAETVSYACDNGMKITASYDNSAPENPKTTLTIAGKQYSLSNAVSASGSRYTSMSGMTDGKAIEWWTKADRGTLSEGPKDDKRLLEESIVVARCKTPG